MIVIRLSASPYEHKTAKQTMHASAPLPVPVPLPIHLSESAPCWEHHRGLAVLAHPRTIISALCPHPPPRAPS